MVSIVHHPVGGPVDVLHDAPDALAEVIADGDDPGVALQVDHALRPAVQLRDLGQFGREELQLVALRIYQRWDKGGVA